MYKILQWNVSIMCRTPEENCVVQGSPEWNAPKGSGKFGVSCPSSLLSYIENTLLTGTALHLGSHAQSFQCSVAFPTTQRVANFFPMTGVSNTTLIFYWESGSQ